MVIKGFYTHSKGQMVEITVGTTSSMLVCLFLPLEETVSLVELLLLFFLEETEPYVGSTNLFKPMFFLYNLFFNRANKVSASNSMATEKEIQS